MKVNGLRLDIKERLARGLRGTPGPLSMFAVDRSAADAKRKRSKEDSATGYCRGFERGQTFRYRPPVHEVSDSRIEACSRQAHDGGDWSIECLRLLHLSQLKDRFQKAKRRKGFPRLK